MPDKHSFDTDDRSPENPDDQDIERILQKAASGNTDSVHKTRFGKYDVVRLLGCHGQATVLLARDPVLKRDVVLKHYHGISSDSQKLRMINEGRALAQLDSPYVARCYAVEQVEGVPFLVLEYVDAPSLADVIEQRQLPINECLQILHDLACGIEPAHQLGILHRDLKPSNVLYNEDNQVKIIDFGLAQEEGSNRRDASGTPAFMSPERAANEGESIDERSDIFGLGAIFYQLLTGDPPFVTESGNQSRELAKKGEVIDVRTLRPDLPTAVASLCMECIQPDVDKRIRSATDLKEKTYELLAYADRKKRARKTLTRIVAAAGVLIAAIILWQSISQLNDKFRSRQVSWEQVAPLIQTSVLDFNADVKLITDESVEDNVGKQFDVQQIEKSGQTQMSFEPVVDCNMAVIVFAMNESDRLRPNYSTVLIDAVHCDANREHLIQLELPQSDRIVHVAVVASNQVKKSNQLQDILFRQQPANEGELRFVKLFGFYQTSKEQLTASKKSEAYIQALTLERVSARHCQCPELSVKYQALQYDYVGADLPFGVKLRMVFRIVTEAIGVPDLDTAIRFQEEHVRLLREQQASDQGLPVMFAIRSKTNSLILDELKRFRAPPNSEEHERRLGHAWRELWRLERGLEDSRKNGFSEDKTALQENFQASKELCREFETLLSSTSLFSLFANQVKCEYQLVCASSMDELNELVLDLDKLGQGYKRLIGPNEDWAIATGKLLADAYAIRGDFETARKIYDELWSENEGIGDTRVGMELNIGLADVCCELGSPDENIEELEQLVAMMRTRMRNNKPSSSLIPLYQRLARCENRLGNFDKAREHALAAATIGGELFGEGIYRETRLEQYCLSKIELATASIGLDQPPQDARNECHEIVELLESAIGQPVKRASLLLRTGQIFRDISRQESDPQAKSNDWEQSLQLAENVLATIKEFGGTHPLAVRAHLVLSDLYHDRKDFEKAKKHISAAKVACEELTDGIVEVLKREIDDRSYSNK